MRTGCGWRTARSQESEGSAIAQNDDWEYTTPPDHPNAASLATVFAMIARAIGITQNVAALQGVIFRTTRVAVDRYGAIGWRYLTGTWPGERRPDPDE